MRKLWLVQNSYIDSLVRRFNPPILEEYPPTPLLEPAADNEVPTRQNIRLYQYLVGSCLYPTVMTRPDSSKVVSMIAAHLQKLTNAHINAAKYAI